jgi:hypothetical protein
MTLLRKQQQDGSVPDKGDQAGDIPESQPFLSTPNLVVLRCLIVFSLLAGLWYLAMRWGCMIQNRTWAGIPFAASETYLFLQLCMALFVLWRPQRRVGRDIAAMLPGAELYPTIDVFIPCYNEPVEIVRETTKAALQLDYPAHLLKVYILDDGSRQGMSMIMFVVVDGKEEDDDGCARNVMQT